MKFIRIISPLLLISLMVLIFSLSSQNADTSSDTSGSVIKIIISFFDRDFDELPESEQQEMISSLQFIARKTAHFTLYALLGFFSFFTYATYKKIPFKIRFVLMSVTCLLYSVSDEIHQLFIPGRSGEVRDVCIDFCGSFLIISLLTLIAHSKKFKGAI